MLFVFERFSLSRQIFHSLDCNSISWGKLILFGLYPLTHAIVRHPYWLYMPYMLVSYLMLPGPFSHWLAHFTPMLGYSYLPNRVNFIAGWLISLLGRFKLELVDLLHSLVDPLLCWVDCWLPGSMCSLPGPIPPFKLTLIEVLGQPHKSPAPIGWGCCMATFVKEFQF